MKRAAAIIAIFLLVCGCAVAERKPASDGLLANDDEKLLWQQAQAEQKALNDSALIYRDNQLEAYLNSVVRRLQPPDLPSRLSFKIVVVRDPYFNAFAFPNGVIYIHTGMLARMDNEAQLAALLAHEMSHCIHRHTLRAYRRVKDNPGLMASIQGSLARLAMVGELARLLGMTGSIAAVSGYARELELEADVAGLDYMIAAGYDPYQALHLFEYLKKDIEGQQAKEPYFFGTHPKVQARIDNIAHLLLTKYPVLGSGDKSSEQFLSRISPVVLANARLELRIGRYSAARRSVEKYLRLHPRDAHAYYLLGEIFRQRDGELDAKRALTHYRKAITFDSSYAEPHKAIGIIHFKEGQRVLARKYFESCLLLAPDTPDKAYIQGYIKQCVRDGDG
jgi:predicted Zn-dependent protease